MKTRKLKIGAILAAVALAASVGIGVTATAASASAPTLVPVAPKVTFPLKFVGFNAERAAANGYSIRTNSLGYQYAVPATNIAGDLTNASAMFDPATDRLFPPMAASGSKFAAPLGNVDSNCGSSWVWFTAGPAQLRTGYLSNPLFGVPVYRTWNVAVHAPNDFLSIPFSGVATGYYWQAYAKTQIYAASGQRVTALAGGTLTTVFADCAVGSPTASVVR
jgi:hypothetical protein